MPMEEEKNIPLSSIPKKDGFKAPDEYFDTLAERIEQKIATQTDGKVVPMGNPFPWKYASLAAAAVAALLILSLPLILNKTVSSPTAEELIAMVSPEDCMYYLQYTDMEAGEILSLTGTEFLFEETGEELVPDAELNDEEIDLLYERYGVTEDEQLQPL